jgi:hypothetical protein
MHLFRRYKQLTLWNKMGFWGAIASIVGLALYLMSSLHNGAESSKSPIGVTQTMISSPNSVQIGSLTVGSPPVPQWKFTEELGQAVAAELRKLPAKRIAVDAIQGNENAYQLAEALRQYLVRQKFSVGSMVPGTFTIFGPPPHGIQVFDSGDRLSVYIGLPLQR